MRYTLSAVFLLSLLGSVSTVTAAGDLVSIPNPSSDAVRFEALKSTGGATYEATGGDGACAVVGGSAMVTGLAGSQFSDQGTDAEGARTLTLLDGGFALHVGSKPVRLNLGESVLTVQSAELLVTKSEAGWVVGVQSFFRGGSAEVSGMLPPPPPPKPVEEPADEKKKKAKKKAKKKKAKGKKKEAEPEPVVKVEPPQPIPFAQALKKGELAVVVNAAKPKSAPEADQQAIKDLADVLEEPAPQVALLVPADVEDKADLTAQGIDREAAFEDIEIEEIEVEAGCVEVCID